MAKMRGIKPETWTDSRIVRLSPLARLMFIASWNFACDNGHVEDDALQLRLRTLPADVCDGEELVAEIAAAGLWKREDGWLVISNFGKHQRVDKRFVVTCDRAGCSKDARGDLGETSSSARRAPDVDSKGSRDEGEGEGEGEVTPTGGPGGQAPATTGKRGKSTKGARLPEIFPITPEMAEWGRANAPEVDAPREHEVFCDYWRGQSGAKGVKADWVATWRNWMRRAQNQIDERRGRPSKAADRDLPEWMLA